MVHYMLQRYHEIFSKLRDIGGRRYSYDPLRDGHAEIGNCFPTHPLQVLPRGLMNLLANFAVFPRFNIVILFNIELVSH